MHWEEAAAAAERGKGYTLTVGQWDVAVEGTFTEDNVSAVCVILTPRDAAQDEDVGWDLLRRGTDVVAENSETGERWTVRWSEERRDWLMLSEGSQGLAVAHWLPSVCLRCWPSGPSTYDKGPVRRPVRSLRDTLRTPRGAW